MSSIFLRNLGMTPPTKDGENDIDMLLSVGKGIAMGNASEKVKEIATDICESVTDDGIYYYLKSQKLINE